MAYEPTLTVYNDASPCPRVEVFFDALAEDTATLTVYRIAGGREHQVRGAVNAATAGTLTRIDFEVPFNTTVSYRAEMFDAAGLSLGFTGVASVSIAVADVWMHNPLDPQGSVRVTLLHAAGKVLDRPVPGEVSYPIGRRVGVVLAQPRRGLAGAVFDVMVDTFEDADKVQALLGDYTTTTVPVICIRLGSKNPMRIPQPLFLGVLSIPEEDFDVADGGTTTIHRISGNESAPPVPGLFIPLLTRNDIDAFYATRDAIDAAYLRRVDIDRDYTLAGYADA